MEIAKVEIEDKKATVFETAIGQKANCLLVFAGR